MRNAGIIDENIDGSECRLGSIKSLRHRVAIAHVGSHRKRLPASLGDAFRYRGQAIRAASDQHDSRTVLRQHVRKVRAQPARRARHQRYFSTQIKQLGACHVTLDSPAATEDTAVNRLSIETMRRGSQDAWPDMSTIITMGRKITGTIMATITNTVQGLQK